MSVLSFLSLLAVLQGIMLGVQPPCWYLSPVELAPGEGVQVFLEDPDDIPPMLAVEVQAQAIPCERLTRSAFASTLTIIPRRLHAFRRFYYTASQSLLLYVIIIPGTGRLMTVAGSLH